MCIPLPGADIGSEVHCVRELDEEDLTDASVDVEASSHGELEEKEDGLEKEDLTGANWEVTRDEELEELEDVWIGWREEKRDKGGLDDMLVSSRFKLLKEENVERVAKSLGAVGRG
ncbi:MAG TPA: hypothetical protein VGJ00_07380 [Rhabdochlamydiaceae bacterium]